MRNFPRVEAVGKPADFDEQARLLEFIEKCWTTNTEVPDAWQEHFDLYEQEKTPEEKRLIELTDQITSAFVEKHGGVGFHVNETRIHLLPKDTISLVPQFKLDGDGVSFVFAGQIILVTDQVRRHPVQFLKVLMHEELHTKSYLSATLGEKGGFRRRGFKTPAPTDRSFTGLDEGLTEDSTYDCLIAAMNNPAFAATAQQIRSPTEKRARKEYAQKNNIPLHEVLWALPDASDGGALTYAPQRQTIGFLQQKILVDHPTIFPTLSDVRTVFYQAKFQGNLLPVARLIEESFGKGAFRVIAKMSDAPDSWSCLKELVNRREEIEAKNNITL